MIRGSFGAAQAGCSLKPKVTKSLDLPSYVREFMLVQRNSMKSLK